MRSHILKLSVAVAALTLAAGPAMAADDFTPEQKAVIQSIIEEHLRSKPELIIESVELYRKKQEEQQAATAVESIKKNFEFLAAADAPSIGNPKGDVTVIEFFDYNCGYCKRAVPDIQAAVKNDPNVRFVFHEMPILSDSSMTAARWALAAHKQGKYFEFHMALMNHNGEKDEASLEKLATDTGLDAAKMKADANLPETAATIEKSMAAAREIGIQGTPGFIINDTLYPGYLGPDGLTAAIESAREKGDKKEG